MRPPNKSLVIYIYYSQLLKREKGSEKSGGLLRGKSGFAPRKVRVTGFAEKRALLTAPFGF
jgi:hypothetical protein